MDDLQTQIARELIIARNLEADIAQAYRELFPEAEYSGSREAFHACVREIKRLRAHTRGEEAAK